MFSDLPSDLVDLQRTATAAWDAVAAYRETVMAARRAERPGADAPLRPWSDEENAEYRRLHDLAAAAQEARRAAIDASGLGHGWDVAQGLHKAAGEQ